MVRLPLLLLKKFTQAMDHQEIDEARVRMSLMSTSSEVFEYYMGDRSKAVEAIERLLALKGYELILKVLREEYSCILENEQVMKRILAILRQNIEMLDDTPFLDALIEILIEVALNYSFSFESFEVCQVISSLVVQNKRFPSKRLAKLYFSKISAFFREGGHFLAYLNALHILNELGSLEFSKREFEFLKKCAALKAERYPKDLFCGIKMRDIGSIAVDNLDDTEGFAYDDLWDIVLDGSRPIPDDMGIATFLMKNGISYSRHDKEIMILGGTSEGFTTKIFAIARSYEPTPVKAESLPIKVSDANTGGSLEENIPNARASPGKKEKCQKPVGKPSVFKNRFMLPYRQLKILNKYAPIDFEDRFCQERNERRMGRFNSMNKKFEEEKAFFTARKEIVDELFGQLNGIIEKKLADQRAEAEEKMKLEKARMKEEQRSKMWSNLPKGSAASPSSRKDSEDSGLYVPKLRIEDASISPGSEIYTPKFRTTDFRSAESTHLPESLSKDIGADPEKKASDTSKDIDEKPCHGSWRSLRKKSNN